MSIVDTRYVRINGLDYNLDAAGRGSLPTAYAPASLTASRSSALDYPDPARLTLDVTVPPENDGRTLRTNLVHNPSFEAHLTAWTSNGSLTDVPTFPDEQIAGDYMAQALARQASPYLTIEQEDTDAIAVEPGQWVAVRLWASVDEPEWHPTGGNYLFRPLLTFGTDAEGHELAATPFEPWAQFYPGQLATLAVQVPAGKSVVRVGAQMYTGDPGQDVMYDAALWLDRVHAAVAGTQADALDQVATYFDAETPPTATRHYAWTGEPHRSPSIEVATDLRPSVGDDVQVAIGTTTTDDFEVMSGKVEAMRRVQRTMRTPDGSTFDVDAYQLDVTDWFGVLARRTVGDAPWPHESIGDRWARIAALVPDAPLFTGTFGTTAMCAPRDVDNVSVLSLLQDTLAVADRALVWNRTEGYIWPMVRSQLLTAPDAWDLDLPDPYVRGGASSTLHLPADVFEDPGSVQDYDLVVNVARVRGKQWDDADAEFKDRTVTVTNDASRAQHGESTFSISGDGTPDFGSEDLSSTAAVRRARRLVQVAGQPVWRLDGTVRALPWLVTPGATWPVVLASDLAAGYTPVVQFDGAPIGRDVWRVVGVTLTWGSDDDALEVEVEPYDMSAPLGLTFVGATKDPPITFDMAAGLTFDRALTIGSISYTP